MEEAGTAACLGNLKIQIQADSGSQLPPFPTHPWFMVTLGWRGGWTGSSRRSSAGSSRAGAAALITLALQAPIRSQKDSRDTAFNNYH